MVPYTASQGAIIGGNRDDDNDNYGNDDSNAMILLLPLESWSRKGVVCGGIWRVAETMLYSTVYCLVCLSYACGFAFRMPLDKQTNVQKRNGPTEVYIDKGINAYRKKGIPTKTCTGKGMYRQRYIMYRHWYIPMYLVDTYRQRIIQGCRNAPIKERTDRGMYRQGMQCQPGSTTPLFCFKTKQKHFLLVGCKPKRSSRCTPRITCPRELCVVVRLPLFV